MRLLQLLYKRKDAVLVISILLFLTKLLGFYKFRMIAGFFGASAELDLFWIASIIPDTLFNILVAGSINAAIIPIFSDVLYEKGERSLVKLLNTTVVIVGSFAIVLTLIIMFFADNIGEFLMTNSYISGQYDVSPQVTQEQISLLVRMMRIMLLSPLLLAISSIISAFLQVHKKFFVTTLAPLLYNLGMIFGMLIFVDKLDGGVVGLALAVVFGALLHFTVQLPITYRFIRDTLHINSLRNLNGEISYYIKQVGEMVKLAIPRIIAFAGEQFSVMFNSIIAFGLTGGALSAYKFAISLHMFPVHILAGAISRIALPNFAEAYSKGQMDKLVALYNEALRKTLFVILPVVAILVVLRLPIVRLAYGTGRFDWWDTVVTSWVLALLGAAIIGQAVVGITLRALYAVHETKLPLVATFVAITINMIGTYYFVNFFSHYQDWRPIVAQITGQLNSGLVEGGAGGINDAVISFVGDLGVWFTTRNTFDAAVGGLALSLSVAFIVEMILDTYFLNRKISFFSWGKVGIPIVKMAFNSLVMTGAMYLVFRFSDFSLDTTRTYSILIMLIVTSVVGLTVYVIMSYATKIKEVNIVTYYLYFFKGIFSSFWEKLF